MARHDLFRILEIGLDRFSPLGSLPLQSIWIDIELPAQFMDLTRKRRHKGPDCIAQNIKNWLFNSLFLNDLQGIVDGHHIIGNDTRRPKLRGVNGITIDTLVVKMLISLIIRKAGNMVLDIWRHLMRNQLVYKSLKTAILSRKTTTSDNKNVLHNIPFLIIYSLFNYTILKKACITICSDSNCLQSFYNFFNTNNFLIKFLNTSILDDFTPLIFKNLSFSFTLISTSSFTCFNIHL